MQGGPNRAYLFIGDSGFDFPLPRALSDQGILSPREFCQQNDIPFFVPFNARGDFGLSYDRATHRLTQVPADEAEVSSRLLLLLQCYICSVQGPISNWRRLVTYLRGSVEQAHAALHHQYKSLRRFCHRAFHVIGRRVIEQAAQRWVESYIKITEPPFLRYGVAAEWAVEQWETCEAYLDYVVAVQMYNAYHAKFRRRLSPRLQVS